ncbi:MAG: class I SAM-dependent methyltransferase [Armatimonadetes bacterium]|nr:class I SAM-dependent methyltransferase [Armatimonadota bacterium]
MTEVQPLTRILVAGCGAEGREVIDIAQRGAFEVVGFDIALKPELHQQRGTNWLLLNADVLQLPFENCFFDAVLYYHVIEHVPNPAQSISELARVMRPEGGMFIGTPNRARLVGYIGSRTSLRKKITRNWVEWKYRLRGRFRNECGAHAGFTEKELDALLRPYFREVRWVTRDYLARKYQHRLPNAFLRLMLWQPTLNRIAPAIYAWAKK